SRQWAAKSTKNYLRKLDWLTDWELTKNCVSSERVPPADPFIRINFDTTFDQKEFRSSSGVIVKNERGEVLLTKSTLHGEVASYFAAEALACSQTVEVGRSLGVDMVEVKGDSLVVIRKCNSK
ncbi:hypothetical protein Gohar_000663, partial [Gossypium harknessii]|nr:hypothetical protein [Gossypium harknessii]